MKSMFGVLMFVTVAFLFTVLLTEWMLGCGEPTYYANGAWVTGECLFIPYEISSGNWK